MNSKGHYAVLLCCTEESEYMSRNYGGYFNMYVSFLGDEGEDWDAFRVSAGEFPKDDVIGSYDGFVISGSCHDADANDGWVLRLVDLLRLLDNMHKHVLGICFGHQILCRALGGRIGRSPSGWDIGVTTVNVVGSRADYVSLIPSQLAILEFHHDEILDLAPCSELLASSNKTKVEIFRHGDHILGIQGHPEYTKDVVLHLMDRLLKRKILESSHIEEAKAKLKALEPDRESWKRFCKGFLKKQG